MELLQAGVVMLAVAGVTVFVLKITCCLFECFWQNNIKRRSEVAESPETDPAPRYSALVSPRSNQETIVTDRIYALLFFQTEKNGTCSNNTDVHQPPPSYEEAIRYLQPCPNVISSNT